MAQGLHFMPLGWSGVVAQVIQELRADLILKSEAILTTTNRYYQTKTLLIKENVNDE